MLNRCQKDTAYKLLLTKVFKINQDPTKNYTFEEVSTALCVFLATGCAYHCSYLRQVELIMNLKLNSLEYSKGLLATMTRHVARSFTLYGLYFLWF